MIKMSPKQLIQHIRDFNGDTSRSPEKTLEALEEARDELDMLIDALKGELGK